MSSPNPNRLAAVAAAAFLVVALAVGAVLNMGDDSSTQGSTATSSSPGTSAKASAGSDKASMPSAAAKDLEEALMGNEFTSYRRLWLQKIPPVPPAGTTVQVLDGTFEQGSEYARVDVKITLPNNTVETVRLALIDQGDGWKIVTPKAVK